MHLKLSKKNEETLWYIYKYFGNYLITFILLSISLIGSYYIRHELTLDYVKFNEIFIYVLYYVPFKLVFLYFFGYFRTLIKVYSFHDLKLLSISQFISMLFVFGSIYVNKGEYLIPRSILLIDYVLSIYLISLYRVVIKYYVNKMRDEKLKIKSFNITCVIGITEESLNFIKDRSYNEIFNINLILDSDKKKYGSKVFGINIHELKEDNTKILEENEINNIIFTNNVSTSIINNFIFKHSNIKLKYLKLKILTEIENKGKKPNIDKIQIEDLVNRKIKIRKNEDISKLINNQVVLVTGGAGSIGSEICRQIINFSPRKLVIMDHSELNVYNISEELSDLSNIDYITIDIYDEENLEHFFKIYKFNVIFHAAAYKHVNIMEKNLSAAIRNNTINTMKLSRLAIRFKVRDFVFISTDKAVNPTNIMGASKRLAEIYLQGFSKLNHNTKFTIVRFGNVLGSSGSVVPKFKRQIENGGPITLSHKNIKRYFMTIPEAVSLVLDSATLGTGGEIFVLNMGKPIKIYDLAIQMINLAGCIVDKDIKIDIVGLKKGEKMYEELNYDSEKLTETKNRNIFCFQNDIDYYSNLEKDIWHFYKGLNEDIVKDKKLLKQLVPEYHAQ